jgi:hypothetical protein
MAKNMLISFKKYLFNTHKNKLENYEKKKLSKSRNMVESFTLEESEDKITKSPLSKSSLNE